MPSTPIEDLMKSNDDFHESADEIMKCEEVPVEVKAKFGSLCDSIFAMMHKAHTLVEEYCV
jgi:coproporphyrinogen III oxidase